MGDHIPVRVKPGVWVALALSVLILPLQWVAAICFSSLVHELCHLAAVRFADGCVTNVCLGLDGAYLETGPMEPKWSVLCSLAGPLGSLLLLPLGRWMPRTALCALIQSAYHLLPIYPLDGGRALRALWELFSWDSRILYVMEIAAFVFLVLTGIYGCVMIGQGPVPLFFPAFLILRIRREKFLANRDGTGYNRCD